MITRTAGLIGLATLLSGCFGQTGLRPVAVAPDVVEGQAQRGGVPPVAGLSASCPAGTAPYRVRDLTVPWAERRYLLPDGGLCCPNSGELQP